MNKNLIIVFTRNLELGKCKTRLAASIGDKNALAIYKILIQHTSNCVQAVDADAVAFYTENIQKNDAWPDSFFQKQLQIEGHLGKKMQTAFQWGFSKGYENICIVGSDLFSLKVSDLVEAFHALTKKDLVFGPAKDGGYYLMGMKKLHPEAFLNKAWSTETVLNETLSDLEGKSIALLQTKNDVDTVEDLIQHPELFEYIPHHIKEKFKIQ